MLDDRESESGPLDPGLGTGMDLEEFVEDAWQCFGWNPASGIGDAEDDRALGRLRGDGDLPSVRARVWAAGRDGGAAAVSGASAFLSRLLACSDGCLLCVRGRVWG